MKNVTIIGLVILFLIAIHTSACDKSKEEATEKPPVEQEEVSQLTEETVEPAVEEASNLLEEQRLAAEKAEAEAEERRLAAERAEAEAIAAREKAAELERDIRQLGAVTKDRGPVVILGDVSFDIGKANLRSASVPVLETLAEFLRKYPERRVMVEGFTDSSGDAENNQKLSERRSLTIKQMLMNAGIDDARIDVKGYGENYPSATNETSEGRAMNRRVEIIISDEEGVIPERVN